MFVAELATSGCGVFACRGGPSLLQTGGGRPPALNSNAVGCVWFVGPLGSAGQFVSLVALHG